MVAARLAFGKPSAHNHFALAVVFVFLDTGLFLRALTKTDKMGNCHKIIPQWVNMSCICTGDFIFWLSDVFLEFAFIPFQFISSHKSEPCIPFPASLALHFRWFWPLSLSRLFSLTAVDTPPPFSLLRCFIISSSESLLLGPDLDLVLLGFPLFLTHLFHGFLPSNFSWSLYSSSIFSIESHPSLPSALPVILLRKPSCFPLSSVSFSLPLAFWLGFKWEDCT